MSGELQIRQPQNYIEVGYYKCIKDDDDIEVDDIICVTSVDDEHVNFTCVGIGYHTTHDDFLTHYEFAPNAHEELAQQITDLMAEIHDDSLAQINLDQKMLEFQPHINDDGKVSESTELARPTTMAGLKKSVALTRNEVAKFKKNILQKQEKLTALVQQQQALVEAAVDKMAIAVKRMEEVVWTLNLYLGRDETIIRLTEGEPAPVDDLISLRQLVLFMDEECAVASDDGGIDSMQIEEFDKWLIKSKKHMQQVIPEEKSVVCLKVRRHSKTYEDPWMQQAIEEADKQTYFLIRNGDNLYRMCTSYNLGSRVFPTKDEFLDVFYTDDHWSSSRRFREPIKPGSDEYMKAMERVDERRRHYYRVALILQGLIDRTKIFHPLPGDHINILNPAEYGKHLRFIYDAEPGTMLTDGRPDFDDWMADANESLGVGKRVIGAFGNYYHGLSSLDDSELSQRMFPTKHERPDSLTLYTIESKSDDRRGFNIYWKRGEIWRRGDLWERSGYGEAKTRARCTLYNSDRFILNFDAVKVDDMEFYLQSRLNRHNYTYMFPLLKRAIKLKKEEEKAEAPFLQLLAGEIAKKHNVSHKQAEEAVPDLVDWWKFKNQTHRALTSDDSKALRMIVEEFDIRRRRLLERLGPDADQLFQELVNTVQKTESDVILVAHKSKNEFVVLVAHDDTNVFVKEQVWRSNRSSNNLGDTFRLKSTKEWCLVDERYRRWHVIYKGERWENWIRDPRKYGYLTDPEIKQLLPMVLEHAKKRCSGQHWRSKQKLKFRPLAVVLMPHDQVYIYVHDTDAVIPKARSGRPDEPTIVRYGVTWKRTPDGFKLERLGQYDGGESHVCITTDNPPWQLNYDGGLYCARHARKVIQVIDKNVDRLAKQEEEYGLASSRHGFYDGLAYDAVNSIIRQRQKAEEKEQYDAYIADDGDPELWEDHQKTLKKKQKHYRGYEPAGFTEALDKLIDADRDVNGLTVGEVYDLAGVERPTHDDGEDELEETIWSLVVSAPLLADVDKEEDEEE